MLEPCPRNTQKSRPTASSLVQDQGTWVKVLRRGTTLVVRMMRNFETWKQHNVAIGVIKNTKHIKTSKFRSGTHLQYRFKSLKATAARCKVLVRKKHPCGWWSLSSKGDTHCETWQINMIKAPTFRIWFNNLELTQNIAWNVQRPFSDARANFEVASVDRSSRDWMLSCQ